MYLHLTNEVETPRSKNAETSGRGGTRPALRLEIRMPASQPNMCVYIYIYIYIYTYIERERDR